MLNSYLNEYEQWDALKKWWKKYTKSYEKGDDFDRKHIYNDGIKSVMPFNKRGKHMIKNWEDARQAAINISKYLG